MNLATKIIAFVLHQVVGDIGGKAVQWLENHFAHPSQALPKAIDQANTQTWRVIELSLVGDSMLGWLKGKIASGVERGVLKPLKEWVQAQGEEFRLACVSELRAARLAGRLNPTGNGQEIAAAGDGFTRCTAPGALLERTRALMVEVAADLKAEYPNLARFLADSEGCAGSLLVGAFGYFLRQAVLDQPKLRDALQFEMLSQVWNAQAHGWEALGQLLTQQGAALAVELERLATEQAELKAMLRQVLERLPAEARQGSVTPRLSASLRSVADVKLLEELERRIQAIPPGQRTPAMLDIVGRLAMAVGVFPRAEEHFREAAQLSPQVSAQAEAHYNRYRALLEQKRWDDALVAFLAAARLDPERFALFPLTKYTPQRILGAGGFGVAFLCEHAYLRRRLVIKSFHTEALERGFEEIFREGELLSNLRHPAIIQVIDGGYTNETHRQRPYLALEYFDAPTLDGYLTQNGCLSLEQSVDLARQIAEALKTAHDKNILHRDLKPDNLLVRRAGDTWEIKIIDFGLAVTAKVVTETAAAGSLGQSLQGESLGGTFLYSAPEQLGLVAEKIGPWSDIYAFGKILSQALFSTTQPSRKNYRVLGDHPLADLLSDCLEQAPRDRPQHFREVLNVLKEAEKEFAQKAAEEESIRNKKSYEPKPGEEREFAGIPFVWIPEGCFNMGSPDSEEQRSSDEGPVHKVCLDGFWLGKYQITQGQWKTLMGNNPSRFKNGDNYPVECVSWTDAQKFIEKLNAKRVGRFRLPTEAEWEYACRAGTTTPFYFGKTISADTQANYDGNYPYGGGPKGKYREQTTPVGSFPANAFGLYDMHGNVWEWCEDWYDAKFYASPEAIQKNPICKNNIRNYRVLRGGSWSNNAGDSRAASRDGLTPDGSFDVIGFRVVRLPQE